MPADASGLPIEGTVTEVELKLRASGPLVLQRLARRRRLGNASLGAPHTVREVDRYLDTADGRLAVAAWACRLRGRDGSTIVSLKGPRAGAVGGRGLHSRPEMDGPATSDPDPSTWPRSPARDLLQRLSGGGRLVERLRLRQQRTERSVEVAGEHVGVLSLDRVTVIRGRRRLGRLLVVEFELTPGTPYERAAGPARALQAIDGLQIDRRSKLEHALSMLRDEIGA
jgi:inorganic triphosphatase YgiF